MHKSRLAGFIIDCNTDDLDVAANFWAAALGAPATRAANLDKSPYVELKMPDDEPYAAVQRVDHDSRVHIDIETDDIEAEVARLEKHGAQRVADIKDWVVMAAPTGQRFCIVPVARAGFVEQATAWEE